MINISQFPTADSLPAMADPALTDSPPSEGDASLLIDDMPAPLYHLHDTCLTKFGPGHSFNQDDMLATGLVANVQDLMALVNPLTAHFYLRLEQERGRISFKARDRDIARR